jgi:hypothetical protein
LFVAYCFCLRLTQCGTRWRTIMQISRAILNEQQKFKAPNWFEENKPPVTKQELEDKIDQLHAAINDVAQQIGPDSETGKHDNNSAETIESVVKS